MAAALDDLDRNILVVLQEDSSLPLDEIARKVGASKTPVWNSHIRKMKASRAHQGPRSRSSTPRSSGSRAASSC